MKNLNREADKAVDEFGKGQAAAEQAAQNNPGAVGTVSSPQPATPDISKKPRGL